MNSYLKIVGVFGLFSLLATSQLYSDNTDSAVPITNVSGANMSSPQDAALQSNANSPTDLVNPGATGARSDLSKAGIYRVGGKLFVDRNVQVKSLLTSSGTITSLTVSSLTVTSGQASLNGVGYTFPSSQATVSGQVLQNDATGTLSWGLPQVVQYVTAQFASATTTNSSTFQSTFLTASITPKTNTDLILVLAIGTVNAPANKVCFLSIFRGSTNRGGTQGIVDVSGNGSTDFAATLLFVDAPATTSSVTYTVKIANNDNASTVQFGNSSQAQTIVLIELKN